MASSLASIIKATKEKYTRPSVDNSKSSASAFMPAFMLARVAASVPASVPAFIPARVTASARVPATASTSARVTATAPATAPLPILPANVPKKIFIIPYRNRPKQKAEFMHHMRQKILLDEPAGSYEMYFAHQCDNRPFNRGAMKNIGFLAMKLKYPLYYKAITFIFHDVDTFPSTKDLINYDTMPGIVKHYYGYEFALGGIFAIKGVDFERSLGFPNFWGWGLEDNVMQDRCANNGLIIDRSQFYPMRDPRIIRAFDGFDRVISKRDTVVYTRETPDDFTSLTKLKWMLKGEYINIYKFTSGMDHAQQDYATHDIRQGNKLLVPQGYDRRSWNISSVVKKSTF